MGTATNNANLQLPTVGSEVGTWGTNLNNNTITPIDQLFGSVLPVTITSADVSLTNSQFQNAIFNLTGGLTGNRNLFVPVGAVSTSAGAGGKFIVTNNTSNNFSVTVNTTLAGALGSIVPQGGRSNLYCDGTNVKTADFGDAAGTFALTVSGNPNGQLAGQAGSSATGMGTQIAYDATNNNLYACATTGSSATAVWNQPAVTTLRGFDTPINLQLNASAVTNFLTVAVKAANTGADPTALNPVTVLFPDSTLTNGDPVTVNVTSALSISTFALGATLGSVNNQSFRFWIVIFNNAGTPVLGLINCSTASGNFSLPPTGIASTTAMSGAATSAGVFYSPNGITLASKAFRVIGFLTYETALATAGTYTAGPDNIRLYGPGVKLPGDILQTVYATNSTATGASGTSQTQTSTTASITPSSKVNLILARASGSLQPPANSSRIGQVQLSRGAGPTLFGTLAGGTVPVGGTGPILPTTVEGLDLPQTTGSQSYFVYIRQQNAADAVVWLGTVSGTAMISSMILQEIMG